MTIDESLTNSYIAKLYTASAPYGTTLNELIAWREDCVKYAMDNGVDLTFPTRTPFFNITECACLFCGCALNITKVYRAYPNHKSTSKKRVMVRAVGSHNFHKIKRSKIVGYVDYMAYEKGRRSE